VSTHLARLTGAARGSRIESVVCDPSDHDAVDGLASSSGRLDVGDDTHAYPAGTAGGSRRCPRSG
jgi:hypothetical protein